MNKGKSKESFLTHLPQLPRLPLITDAEMDELFGEEMAAALAELDRFNKGTGVCANCPNRCCQTSSCELYAPQFRQCPIHDLRPVVCRLHFCHRFQATHGQLVMAITDIFFDCLVAAEAQDSARARLFDCPPLTRTAPEFVAVISPWINAVLEGTLTPEDTASLVRHKAEDFCGRSVELTSTLKL